MKTNSQIKAYHELDQIERDTVESLFLATHSDVFAYLGRHRLAEGDEVVRVLIPGTVSVDIVNRHSGELIVPSEKIDERGFFVAVLPDEAPDYALSIRYTEDSEPVIEEDPYHFSSALQDMDSWLLAEGKHLRPYETLGAHFAELDGVKGVCFAVWAPNAQRVSVIGEFNNWDGRRHVMRFHRDNGIWDIFIPAVKLNALYKFEIRDANGDVREKPTRMLSVRNCVQPRHLSCAVCLTKWKNRPSAPVPTPLMRRSAFMKCIWVRGNAIRKTTFG